MENIFLYKGRPIKSVDRIFKHVVHVVGIEDFRFHDIRHCVITRWRREKKDYLTIRRITGHKTMKVFERYNSFDLSDLRKVVEEPQNIKKVDTFPDTGKDNIQQSCSQVIDYQQSIYAGVVQR